jgi:hypothetical protein
MTKEQAYLLAKLVRQNTVDDFTLEAFALGLEKTDFNQGYDATKRLLSRPWEKPRHMAPGDINGEIDEMKKEARHKASIVLGLPEPMVSEEVKQRNLQMLRDLVKSI